MADQEVKSEVEVIGDIADTTETVDETPDDSVIVPPVDEDELKRALSNAGASGATDTTNTADSSDVVDDDPSQGKPVDGETQRERALRKEVERLKNERRRESQERIAGHIKPPVQSVADERLANLKKTYSDEELMNMEEVIDVIATKKGYVRKDQTYQETVNDVLDSFVEHFPQYKPVNDKDDARWNKFQNILFEDYNIHGKTPKQLVQIFSKVHRDVEIEMGETITPRDTNKINAQQQKIKSVSHSGGTQSAGGSNKTPIDPSVRKMFKGFDDEDLA